MRKKARAWLGGYVRHGKRGPVFVIERRVGGLYFHVSTRCRTERAALEQLARFEADPIAYRPQGEGNAKRLLLTPELVDEYAEHCATLHNSPQWIAEKRRLLADWCEDLGERDLRRLELHHLKAALAARRVGRRHRTEAIKHFFGWMRKERGLLRHSEDATLNLPVPVARAEKLERRKVVPQARVLALLPHLPEATRDVVALLCATGWHVSEVARFAKGGEIVPAAPPTLAVLVVRHKSGELTRTPLRYPEHLEAARRVRARGQVRNRKTLAGHIERAARLAGVDPVNLGSLRHSVATWAVEAGASPAEVAEFLGHRSQATTRRFYIDLAAPTVAVPVLRLVR